MNKDAIKTWLENNFRSNSSLMTPSDALQKHLARMIENCMADIGPKWISVDEALPGKTECVFVFNGNRHMAFYDDDGARWYEATDYETIFNVSHWMPLPGEPKPHP